MALTRSGPSPSGDHVVRRRGEKTVSPTAHVTGLSLLMLVPGMLLSTLIEWGASDQYSNNEWGLLGAAAITALVGGGLWATTTVAVDLRPAQVYSSVAFTWIACSLAGALPYVLGSMFEWSHFDDALFESVSGFSATGSTVLSDIESNGRGVLIWRQLTQWYGGMGMVVLAVTILPALGVGGLSLMSAEAPGPASDRLVPRVSETARRLWLIYCGVTVALMAALWIVPGPNLYDAFAHALTTASTGGFSTWNSSIGHYDSIAVEAVIEFGLLFCAINFTFHYQALKRNFSGYRHSSDLHWLLYLIGGAIVGVTALNWLSGLAGFGTSFRHAVFNVITLATSGGFGNATSDVSMGNYVTWAPAAQALLLPLMIIGGSVGSTAGGLKMFRAEVAMSHLVRQMQIVRRPRRVMPLKIGKKTIAEPIARGVLAFVTLFIALILIGTLMVTALGGEFITSTTAIISAMSNMGPALGDAGPTANFADAFSRPARMVIAVFMLIGRLEIFAVLLMFASITRTVRARRVASRRS